MGSRENQTYRNWIEDLELGIAGVSPSGQVRYANAQFSQILGIRNKIPWHGQNLFEYLAAASAPDFRAALEEALHHPVEGEIQILTANDFRIVRASFHRIKGSEQTIRIVISEITKIVEADLTLKKYAASVQSLSARILRLQDEERRRIARELHDTTGQDLAVMLMSLAQVKAKLEQNGSAEGAQQTLNDAISMARKVEDQIRNLSYVLHPPLLDELGLSAALRWYVEGFTKRTGINVELVSRENPLRLVSEHETALFRVVQECLSNILRHSGSTHARVRLAFLPGNVEVSVRDYGKGMPLEKVTEATKGKSLGVGIAGMRERLEQLGGSIDIRSTDRGTLVVARLPAETRQAPVVEKPEAAPLQGAPDESGPGIKRILIVEDHDVTRRGIRSLLEKEADLEICGEAEDGLQAVSKTSELAPDLVLLDLTLPKAGGFSAIKHIKNCSRTTKILVFTNHAYPFLVSTLQSAGCDGYVNKSKASEDLLRGIRAVLAGQKFFDSESLAKAASASS